MNRRHFLKDTLRGTAGSLALAGFEQPDGISSDASQSETWPAHSVHPSRTLLFFDDWPLNRRDHVARRLGHPVPVPEAVFVDPHLNVTWGYPSVFRDPRNGQWCCLYQGWDHNRNRLYPLLAEGGDGIQWKTISLTGKVDWPGRVYPHQVLPAEGFSEWSPCFYDERARPSERLKGLVVTEVD